MGDLVDRHPGDQLVAIDPQVARGRREVRREQQQARRGTEESSSDRSYWPSTRWESIPVTAPSWAPSTWPEAVRNGPDAAPRTRQQTGAGGALVGLVAFVLTEALQRADRAGVAS